MTEQQVLDTIEEIRPNIKRLAYIFVPKMKQPSTHRPEDLEQEAIHCILQQIDLDRFKEEEGATLQSYLIRSVLTRFIDLMKQSYKVEPVEPARCFTERTAGNNAGEIDLFLEIMESFTPAEKRYTAAMLFPSSEIQSEISKDRKVTRKLTRKELGITRKEEFQIRNSIQEKLAGRVA
jgi:hypothetical protein